MMLKLLLELPEEQPFIRVTRQVGRSLLESMNVMPQDVDEIELVVGELCTNVVRHAHSSTHNFRIALEYHNDRIVVEVEDRGQGFSPTDVAPVGSEREDFDGQNRIGGFGLQLVETLADHLEFNRTDPHGTTVRAERKLRYQTDADANPKMAAVPAHV